MNRLMKCQFDLFLGGRERSLEVVFDPSEVEVVEATDLVTGRLLGPRGRAAVTIAIGGEIESRPSLRAALRALKAVPA